MRPTTTHILDKMDKHDTSGKHGFDDNSRPRYDVTRMIRHETAESMDLTITYSLDQTQQAQYAVKRCERMDSMITH